MLRFKATILILISYALFSGGVMGQIFDPVEWEFTSFKTGENEYDLVFKAEIEDCWHIYSQTLEGDEGPLPLWFSFEENAKIEFVDDVIECENQMLVEFDPNFEMNLNFYEGQTSFRQHIKVLDASADSITGFLSFMVCDPSKCLPPEDIDFGFALADATEMPADFTYCPDRPRPPCDMHEGGSGEHTDDATDDASTAGEGEEEEEKGLWALFFIGFGLGFAALLTPCVFPMIPMTVSFFTKTSKTKAQGIRNALLYGFFIIVIYTGLGLVLTAIFGVDILNAISTNPWFNLFLFALLVIFGLSFLGAFEITLPASWANKADAASDKGGVAGIFFMAATLAIVSFSCTGPLVGSALAGAAKGGYGGPATIMFGFSLALSLPFMLFSAFPGWLNSLPQSGGWLNSVKVVLGLLEIGFAFKFLSNADLVWQAGLLKRELFISIWVAISTIMTLYLFNFIRFSHDSKTEKVSTTRFGFGLLFLVLTIYMVPGISGAPLKIISGFPPPMFYAENPPENHVEAHFQDYDLAMAEAIKQDKPLLVDYTGWACVNCRKMEETVWPDPAVAEMIMQEVILVSLYVDERIDLPEDEQRVEKYGDKDFKIKTVGNKWSYMQASKYNTNAQPYYVLEDHDGNAINGSASYDPDVKVFKEFLEKGIKKFK
jgi:thiol:disulfide interchange protein